MPVITRCEIGIYTLQKINGRLVIRVLGNKFPVDGEVKNFALSLFDGCLQVVFVVLDNIN